MTANSLSAKHMNCTDVVVCCAVRSPITKSKRGALQHHKPEELLQPLFNEVVNRTGIEPASIQDICIGNVLQNGSGALNSRLSQLLAGVPTSTPLYSVNRFCSSGLQAVANIAASIKAGYIDIGIAGGVESMSITDMLDSFDPSNVAPAVFNSDQARNCLLPMGITSENVAERFQITRPEQDFYAVESHRKAAEAQRLGYFRSEIVPIKGSSGYIFCDDGIRESTTIESLSELKPVFKVNGTTTAGNSSIVSDGAAMVLLARRDVAEHKNLPILAEFVQFVAVGVPPDIMGIGPAVAIPELLRRVKLEIDDIDIFEINEAFASQLAYCVRELKIPKHKLNPNGGAIALGHPLGATGCRQIATLLSEMRRRNVRFGVVSMCVGTGMGAAALIQNLQFSNQMSKY